MDITADWERTRQEVAEQATAYPELYIPRLGGTAGETVDLAPLWDRAVAARTAPGQLPPEPSVDLLAEEAGGLALRLRAALRAFTRRRDGLTFVSDEPEGPQEGPAGPADGAIALTMWSPGGDSLGGPWWANTRLFVYLGEHKEVLIHAPKAEFIVATADIPFPENPFTDHTRFVDSVSDPRSCILGAHIATVYRAHLARSVVRGIIANRPTPDAAAITAEEFLRTLEED
ncbi:hypothetical protein AGRA3207_003125 [Actinomadura graeca]|uniref:Uncharacterized protein n=1 Tax=Actinomadura graeca TaxID=2750812 RepID=A0ABX8QUW9_9ACTN|nr:hypothetical protein [Actinomadura graeca]QXJ22166.1 hypothetical protein AGRA3207_003125 [Actinomadura graeca]